MNYDRSTDVTYTCVRRRCAKKGGGCVHGGDGDNEREKRKSHGVGGKRGRRVGKGKEHFGRGSGNVLIARTKVRCLVLRGNPPLPFLLLFFSFSSPSSSSSSFDIYPSFSQFLPDFLPSQRFCRPLYPFSSSGPLLLFRRWIIVTRSEFSLGKMTRDAVRKKNSIEGRFSIERNAREIRR